MVEFTEDQKDEIKKMMEEQEKIIAQRTALFENTITFIELSLSRSKQFGDRPEIYNAGVNLYNLVVKPQQSVQPQPAPAASEPNEESA